MPKVFLCKDHADARFPKECNQMKPQPADEEVKSRSICAIFGCDERVEFYLFLSIDASVAETEAMHS